MRMLNEYYKVRNTNYINLVLSKKTKFLIELMKSMIALNEMSHISQKKPMKGYKF